MFSRQTCQIISFGMVGCMLAVAWNEFYRGAQVADIHLVTSVQLVPGSTVVFTGAAYHEDAVIEAIYLEPPDTNRLHNEGLICRIT